jgi:hypothetical protein
LEIWSLQTVCTAGNAVGPRAAAIHTGPAHYNHQSSIPSIHSEAVTTLICFYLFAEELAKGRRAKDIESGRRFSFITLGIPSLVEPQSLA